MVFHNFITQGAESLHRSYRVIVDHLTKALGALGAGILSVTAFIDPPTLRAEIETYLGNHAAEKVGAILFALVVIRGWYTGWKAKQSQKSPTEGK